MAFRPLLRRRAVVPVTGGLLAAGFVLFPKITLHAEAPGDLNNKKPIYDSPSSRPSSTSPSSISPLESQIVTSATPTARLAAQIKRTRLFLYGYAVSAEDSLNNVMDRLLHMESSFTSTIASLAPPKESGERVMPGTIYVLVSTMAASIVSRNRGIILRASLPLAVGIGTAWVVLPITMRNISDLVWVYEEKFPAVRDTHLRTRESVVRGIEMTKLHSALAGQWIEDKVGGVREELEGWVKKGK